MPAADEGVLLTRDLALDLREMVRQWKAGATAPAAPVTFDRGGTRLLLGKTTESHPRGAVHTVQIFTGDASQGDEKGEETEAGERSVEAYNRLLGTLDAGAWVLLARLAGTGWEIVCGDSGCDCPNTWHLSAHGAITGGTFALPFTLGTGGGATTEIIEVPWSATAAELQTLLRSHSLVETPSEVVCTLGPLPGREIHITLSGSLAGYTTSFNTPDSTLLEGDPGAQVRIGTFRPVAE